MLNTVRLRLSHRLLRGHAAVVPRSVTKSRRWIWIAMPSLRVIAHAMEGTIARFNSVARVKSAHQRSDLRIKGKSAPQTLGPTRLTITVETAPFLASFDSNALMGQSIIVSHGWFME
jgi:hypothetical protein